MSNVWNMRQFWTSMALQIKNWRNQCHECLNLFEGVWVQVGIFCFKNILAYLLNVIFHIIVQISDTDLRYKPSKVVIPVFFSRCTKIGDIKYFHRSRIIFSFQPAIKYISTTLFAFWSLFMYNLQKLKWIVRLFF